MSGHYPPKINKLNFPKMLYYPLRYVEPRLNILVMYITDIMHLKITSALRLLALRGWRTQSVRQRRALGHID